MEGFRFLSDNTLQEMKNNFNEMIKQNEVTEKDEQWTVDYKIQAKKVCLKWIKAIDKEFDKRIKTRKEVI